MKTLHILTNPFIKVFRGYGSTDRDKLVVFLALFGFIMLSVALFGKSGHTLPPLGK